MNNFDDLYRNLMHDEISPNHPLMMCIKHTNEEMNRIRNSDFFYSTKNNWNFVTDNYKNNLENSLSTDTDPDDQISQCSTVEPRKDRSKNSFLIEDLIDIRG